MTEPTKEIVINALKLKLATAKISVSQSKASQSFETTQFSYDEKKQRATLSFADEIPASQKATLEIVFEGIINNDMAGFYRSKYKPVTPAAASVPRDEQSRKYLLGVFSLSPCCSDFEGSLSFRADSPKIGLQIRA